MRSKLLILAVVTLSTTWLRAETAALDLPDAPHKFWNKQNVAAFAVNGAAKGADFYFTHRSLTVPGGKELNPIARPFVSHGTPLQAAYFAGSWVGDVGVAYILHRTGHHKLERIATFVGIGYSVDAAAFTALHYHYRPVR